MMPTAELFYQISSRMSHVSFTDNLAPSATEDKQNLFFNLALSNNVVAAAYAEAQSLFFDLARSELI